MAVISMNKVLPLLLLAVSSLASAEVGFFMEQTTVIQPSGHVYYGAYDVKQGKYPDGKYPFIGKVGFTYTPNTMKYFDFSVGYMHRSNWDINHHEYSYNAPFISIRVKSSCLFDCVKKR